MLAKKRSNTFAAIYFEKPADFIPGAKFERALNNQVRVVGKIQLRHVIFLKMRNEPAGNFCKMGGWRKRHADIITC